MVTIEGRNFCNGDCASAAGEIVLGLSPPQVRVMVVAFDATEATIRIPTVAPIGATEIVMTIDEQASNALPFEVLGD